MSNGSPTAYLLWAILSFIFLAFLLLHLWAYDQFKCLKWDAGRQPGAFKRVMTYSYVATLPLLVVFGVSMTVLKFKEGYWVTPDGEVVPRPIVLWTAQDKHRLLPMYFVLSFAWALELVTHLEELAFWLFLLHQGPGKREWFESWEFRTWYLGSMVAVLGMPLTTLVTRRDLERVLAWIFLVGASAGTTTTIAFLYVLARFPGFIQYVKEGGAEPDVVIRLATFYSLNRIRVMFRFLFTIPLLIIGIDAIRPPQPIIISDPFAVDFLLMMGGIGCFISSAITLLIFFPRSITRESGYKAKIITVQNPAKLPSAASPLPNYYPQENEPPSPKAHSPITGARMSAFRFPTGDNNEPASPPPPVRATESRVGYPRRSAESETSPGYETDAESIAPVSPSTVQFHAVVTQRQGSSQTAMSRPTSGGRSDDTVWERHDDYSLGSARRRHADGPFVYDRQGVIVTTIPGSGPSSEEGHRSNDRERAATPSLLHPYLINFTSPIDLLDDTPQEERPPLHPHISPGHTHMV